MNLGRLNLDCNLGEFNECPCPPFGKSFGNLKIFESKKILGL
jgi:hypothetical protein